MLTLRYNNSYVILYRIIYEFVIVRLRSRVVLRMCAKRPHDSIYIHVQRPIGDRSTTIIITNPILCTYTIQLGKLQSSPDAK